KAALENNLKTVAVLAHGFKTIYPIDNRTLATKIIAEGGALVTEYTSDKMPLPHCFLQRNRIVAGLCGATLIIESPMKGGSMNTAATANSYSREVFALPGRANDDGSQGTNNLIKSTRASMVTSFSDVEA
ncbi:MAG: DNA-processing protein DprA, partial [Rikenellaceae bacterium]